MRNKILISAAFVSVLGCGGGKSSNSSSGDPATATVAKASADANDLFVGAKLVDTAAEMGTCAVENFRQLIYVVEITQFYYCAKAGWQTIDLKGPKGDTGETGAAGIAGNNGAAGNDGAAGKNGLDGSQGQKGKDGENPSTLIWRHPINQEKWFLGRSFLYNSLFSGPKVILCPSGAHSPSNDEFTDAVLAGMWNQLGPSGNDGKLLMDQVSFGTAGQWHIKVGHPNGNISELNANNVNLSDYVYSVCIVD